MTEQMALRLTKEDVGLLGRLAKRSGIPRATIARLAIRLGVQAIEKDPAVLFAVQE